MRVLTLHEPYATLVACGLKRYETRSWGTTYRGRLAIHAARKWDAKIADDWHRLGLFVVNCHVALGLTQESAEAFRAQPIITTLGCILCVCTLSDCRPMMEPPSEQESYFGFYGEGRHGWKLDDLARLSNPVPYRGGQGMRILTAEMIMKLQREGIDCGPT